MEQKYNLPQTEAQLKDILDQIYAHTKSELMNGSKPKFKGLLEIVSAESTIITAIHNIKGNSGAKTPGTDGMIIGDIIEEKFDEIIDLVKQNLFEYKPKEVRRVWIDKPGKTEKRPLGIPTIVDRIVQECVRIVIEPIFEAQFFAHSYGFRPMRDAKMALKRVTSVIHLTKQKWVVEGDISKFFDNVNHRILISKMWGMGVRDQRILMIIKAMLKAGIMEETEINEIGTPQGGIISPLLANIYLHTLDMWIAREWEEKVTKYPYKRKEKKFDRLRKASNLKPAFFIRYADDWVLITDTKDNAEKWKNRIAKYLETNLKLKLSDEKTLITDCTQRTVKFLGYEIKAIQVYKRPRGQKDNKEAKKDRLSFNTPTKPQKEKFRMKVKLIHQEIRKLRKIPDFKDAVHQLNLINTMIRGVVNYYSATTSITTETKKYSSYLQMLGYKYLKRHGAELINTHELRNLMEVHQEYNQTVPALDVGNKTYVGLTNLSFTKWVEPQSKNQNETPYTVEGRRLYLKRTNKTLPLTRADEYFNLSMSYLISKDMKEPKYNFEYFMNRGYVINRDKFKCRVCKTKLYPGNTHVHHCYPKYPLSKTNKVGNLASVCIECHKKIHNVKEYKDNKSFWNRLLKFREKLDKV